MTKPVETSCWWEVLVDGVFRESVNTTAVARAAYQRALDKALPHQRVELILCQRTRIEDRNHRGENT